jgi:hypothetical protein
MSIAWLLAILLIFAIAWWAISQLTLPPPVRMAVAVIVAILAIVMILQFIGGVPVMHLPR